jgi:putative spermidine/putrescine transport system ATP-binding protein
MRTELKRIHLELGRSTIYVTHDQDEALSLADRVVVLRDGRVQQIGVPEDVYARPANLDVARFMGYRNIIPLEVSGIDNGIARLSGEGVALRGALQSRIDIGPATAAIRPDDLALDGMAGEGVVGRVDAVEYCGRDYLVDLVTETGLRLHARSLRRVAPGEILRCSAAPDRVLVYPAEA